MNKELREDIKIFQGYKRASDKTQALLEEIAKALGSGPIKKKSTPLKIKAS